MRQALCFGILLFAVTGCRNDSNSIVNSLDSLIYKSFGFSLANNASSLSIKELRLSGNIVEAEVEIEGQVQEISPNNTYFVISDQTARLLVVTTELLPAVRDAVFQSGKGLNVKVIGKVEIGKKGLPFLKASAITKSEAIAENGQKS